MLPLAADANFNGRILRGLALRIVSLDVITAQDARLEREPDPGVLAWAAEERRVLLTHDIRTMPPAAAARIADGLMMAGVFLVSEKTPIGEAIEALRVLILAGQPGDMDGRVEFL